MLHACAARFDVTGNLEKFCELNKALLWSLSGCGVGVGGFPLSLRFTACAGLDALLLGNRARRPKTRETRLPAVWLRFSSRCAVLRRARAPRLRCVPRARAHPHEPRCRAGLALHRCTPSTAPRLRRAESVSFFPRAWVGAPCVLLLPNAALLAATRQRANLRRRARQI